MKADWGKVKLVSFDDAGFDGPNASPYVMVHCLRCDVWVASEYKANHRRERCERLREGLAVRRRAEGKAMGAFR